MNRPEPGREYLGQWNCLQTVARVPQRREQHVSSQVLLLAATTATLSFLVSCPFTLPCWPFIYTCQEAAIKAMSLHPNFYYKTICIPERKINPMFSLTALVLRFGDLFRLITLTAHRLVKHWFDWKTARTFFSAFPAYMQGLLSEC